MTAPEAMKYLGVNRNTLYAWVEKKLVPHRWVGCRLRFDKDKLDAWLAEPAP